MKSKEFKYTKVDLCRQCKGTGHLAPVTDSSILPVCEVCAGTGRILRNVKGIVIIEPYRRDTQM